jgi:hypothetical protein
MKLRPVPIAAAVVILVVTGLAHGLRTDRWGLAAQLEAATSRLQNIPQVAGAWEGKPVPLDERQLKIAQAKGQRLVFVHPVTREQVSLAVFCGRPGNISNHTPDVCFQGAGYHMEGEAVRHKVEAAGGVSGEFWTATFVREGPPQETLRVWWAWGRTGEWQASDSPRLHFALYPCVYKLYVVSTAGNEDLQDDPGRKLLAAILPDLQAALSP